PVAPDGADPASAADRAFIGRRRRQRDPPRNPDQTGASVTAQGCQSIGEPCCGPVYNRTAERTDRGSRAHTGYGRGVNHRRQDKRSTETACAVTSLTALDGTRSTTSGGAGDPTGPTPHSTPYRVTEVKRGIVGVVMVASLVAGCARSGVDGAAPSVSGLAGPPSARFAEGLATCIERSPQP